MAYNEFRRLTGARLVNRQEFTRTVERHNRGILTARDPEFRKAWDAITLDEDTPEV